MNLEGTETEQNLLKAFAGESQARNRYTYYASIAKKEGYVNIAAIFEDTANQEKEHAKRFFKFLDSGRALAITASYPAGKIGKTVDNLRAAADGENEEWTELYPNFARIAREEGFDDVAGAFESISIAEKNHESRYRAMIKDIEDDAVFKVEDSISWRCRNCGYIHDGHAAPPVCPACIHAQAHFEKAYEPWVK